MNKVDIKQTAALLRQNDGFLLLCHRYPDGDTIGSAFALQRAVMALGKKARVICADLIPSKYGYLFDDIETEDFSEKFVVAVDVADPKLLGLLEEEYGQRVDLCIDHHGSNLGYAKNLLLDSSASATGEIIYHLLPELGVKLDRHIADALFTALSTDTGCFRYGNTTPQTMRIAAELMELGIDAAGINRAMFETKSRARMEIERAIYATLEYWFGGQCAVICLTDEMINEAGAGDGDLEGLAPIPKRIEGVKIGVTMREGDGGYKVSVRTSPGLNACDICKRFGGGGHPAASGCFIEGSADEVKFELKSTLESYL